MNVLEQFLVTMAAEAKAATHPWPEYAACEAALESAWGTSKLYLQAGNIFGMKQHHPPIFDTIELPTKEYVNGQWQTVIASWVKYPTAADCFADRLDTLRRLSLQDGYERYAAALAATTGEDFIIQVSAKWSTDPDRAKKVLETYAKHAAIFTEAS